MEFLGYSQTFIGVLTSLVVLCVIVNTSNFIHEILEKIGNKIDKEIDTLDHTINIEAAYDKNVKVKAPYKLLQQFIKGSGMGEKRTLEEQDILYREALLLDMMLKASFDNFKSEYSPKLIKPARVLITAVKDTKEQVISPLYVLLYCILVFICDELVYNIPTIESFVVTFITAFTILSFSFWGLIWTSFMTSIQIDFGKMGEKRSEKEICMCDHLKWVNTSFYIILSCIISLVISKFLIPMDLVVFKKILFYGIGLFAPIIVVATLKIRSRFGLKEYLYMFVFDHFFCLLFLSLVVSGIIVYENALQICFIYENFVVIKFMIISFIIINGLLLPFIIPFKGFYRVLNRVKKEIAEIQTKLDDELKDITKQLDEFCYKI